MAHEFAVGAGHVHGDIHDGAEAGKENARKEELTDVDERILGDEHQVFDIADVIAGQVSDLAKDDGGQTGNDDTADGRGEGSAGFCRPAVEQVERGAQDNRGCHQGSQDRRHAAQNHGEEETDEAAEGQNQSHRGSDALAAADEAEKCQEDGDEAVDRPRSVDVIDRVQRELADRAGNDDDRHTGLRDGTKEETVRAVRFDCAAVF